MKIKTLRVQKNPPGIDGDIGECRFYHDSFVLDSKVNGLYLYAIDRVVSAPTLALPGDSVIAYCEMEEAEILYTTDGTNPKTSETAKVYTVPVVLEPGQTMRAFAHMEGLLNSAITALTL